MRRAIASTALASLLVLGPGAVAWAQDDEGSAGPTTLVTETETEETTLERTVTSTESRELEAEDDDDDDKTGLWGLLGLLGLLGLAGLARRRHTDDRTYTSGTVSGDTTPRGATTRDH